MTVIIKPKKQGKKMIENVKKKSKKNVDNSNTSYISHTIDDIKMLNHIRPSQQNERKKKNQQEERKKKEQQEGNKLSKLNKKLNKAYNKNIPNNNIPVNFQHPKASTIIIYDGNSKEIYRCKGRIKKKVINKIGARHPNAVVMVDLGNGLYKTISVKTFKKLIKIKFVQFERDYEFYGTDGHEFESMNANWYSPPEEIIDNVYSINQLLRVFIMEEAFDKANEAFLAAKFFYLTGVDKICKILYHSGKTEKMKYEKFLKKYKLDVTMDFFN